MNDSTARIVRTILQFIAGGGLTILVDQLIKDIPVDYQPYIVVAATLVVTIAQNLYEQLSGQAFLRPSSPPALKEVEVVAQV